MRLLTVCYCIFAIVVWLASFFVTPGLVKTHAARVILSIGLLAYFMLCAVFSSHIDVTGEGEKETQ